MKRRITVRLPEDLRSELEDISEAGQKTLSDIVRNAVRRYVAIYQFRRLRNKVLPFAEAQVLMTDEDVFEALS